MIAFVCVRQPGHLRVFGGPSRAHEPRYISWLSEVEAVSIPWEKLSLIGSDACRGPLLPGLRVRREAEEDRNSSR
jgi:hypothetical protein